MELRPSYPIITDRLRLRPLEVSDIGGLLRYHSSDEVHRYLPMEAMDEATLLDRIASGGSWSRSTLEEEGQHVILGVELAHTATLIGDVMIRWTSAKDRTGELGYVFDPAYVGHGYATEAATEVLRMAFEEMGLHRMITRIDARNAASVALSERIGMRREALFVENAWFRGAWTDEVNFAILDREWQQR